MNNRAGDKRAEIVFFGGFDPHYPRNAILRKGMTRCGMAVEECRVGLKRKVTTRYPALLWKYLRLAGGRKILFVPDFRHKDVPLAWSLARLGGHKLIFDPLVSRYETRVLDRGDISEGTPQSWHNRNLDRLSMRLPDLVLADTDIHASYYAREFDLPENKLRTLRIGFDDDIFGERRLPPETGTLKVLFYGSFLPLHGIDTIVDAARRLRGERINFRIFGSGQTYRQVEERAKELSPKLLSFHPPMAYRDLSRLIAEADVVLGIFGTTLKTQMVIPNKVFQALAVGRALITADSPAVKEIFRDGEHLLTVPPGDPTALAEALRILRDDAELRKGLAREGGVLVREEYNPRRVAERLIGLLREFDIR
ncbi:MAG: glycosyltransferase [Candidatus Krumholzibacteriota bacterium]|nr:glycosyltransferase [Candidatus Krumholzibacteriota bacterium]